MKFLACILAIALLAFGIGTASAISMGSCSDGTPYGQCSQTYGGSYCTGLVGALSLEPDVVLCPCSNVSGYVQQGTGENATCVLANGSQVVINQSGTPIISTNQTTIIIITNLSQSDISGFEGYADAINASRNYMTSYGPAEKTCMAGTYLAYLPCSNITSCTATASLICQNSGSTDCDPGVLAADILAYSQAISSLNQGYAQVYSANTIAQMATAFSTLQNGMNGENGSLLRMTSAAECPDCLGVCPAANLNYTALDLALGRISLLNASSQQYMPVSNATPVVTPVVTPNTTAPNTTSNATWATTVTPAQNNNLAIIVAVVVIAVIVLAGAAIALGVIGKKKGLEQDGLGRKHHPK